MDWNAGFEVMGLFAKPIGLHISKILLAILLLAVSAIITKLLQMALVFILSTIRVDDLSEKIGLTGVLKRSGLNNSASALLGELFFWAAMISAGIKIIYFLKMAKAISLTRTIAYYFSINMVNAVFVLILAVIFGSLLAGLVLFIGALIALPGYKLIARVAQYASVIYGIVMALEKLGISTAVFLARPDIILGFFALAGAIAFGLGCKDLAASWLANFIREK